MVGDTEPVGTIFFVRAKAPVQKEGAVCHMNAVHVQGEGVCAGFQPEQVQKTGNAFGQSGLTVGPQLLVNGPPNLRFIGDAAFFCVEAVLHANHGVLGEKTGAELGFLDFTVDQPDRGFSCGWLGIVVQRITFLN